MIIPDEPAGHSNPIVADPPTRTPPPPRRSYRRIFRRVLARIGLGTILALALPLLAVFLWLRLYGLPEAAKIYLLSAIQRHHVFPYPLAVDRFLLDATGAILADHVVVYRDAERQSILLKVDQVRISIAWLSWWRGRGLIDGASISNAEVQYPVGPQETADFQQVNADVAIDGRDIKIENAQAEFLNLALSVRGTIHNDGFLQHKPPTEAQLEERQKIWRSVLKAVHDVGTERPIQVELEFETPTRDPAAARANFVLEGQNLTWRSAPIDEVSIHGSLNDGVVSLSDFKIGLERGDLTAYGEWNIQEHAAQLQFTSSMDFTSLAPAFPGPIGEALGKLSFPNTSPGMSGRVLFDLHSGIHTDLQADLDWRDFTFNQIPFSRLSVPVAYDGKRLLVPGLKIVGQAGNVDLEMFYDATKTPPSLNAKIASTLDPTILRGVFGQGFDKFLASCSFPGGGPKITATATGSALKTAAISVTGKMITGRFSYKGASFDSAISDFTFADSKLSLPDLQVSRPEGKGSGGIVYDFKNRSVELHNLVTQINVAEVAPIMGPKFTEYTKPYHFQRPPLVHANGRVDLQDTKKNLDTDLLVQIDAKTPMEWTLFHVPFSFDNPQGNLIFKDRLLTVEMKQCGFYGGALTGTLALDLSQNPAAYVLDLKLAKVDFKRFMVRAFNYDKSTGEMTGTTHLSGSLGNLATMGGTGEAKIESGNIAQIPLLGSLTPLIPLLSAADAAHADFTINQGVMHTDDLHISSETLALIGNGSYSLVNDQVSLDMRVNVNSVFGIIAYPVSKFFEFHGTGPMKEVKWVPRNF